MIQASSVRCRSVRPCGRAWTALVENRRKDGDPYRMRANATPVRRGGTIIGYLSVRT